MALSRKQRTHSKSSDKTTEEIEGPVNSRILVQLDSHRPPQGLWRDQRLYPLLLSGKQSEKSHLSNMKDFLETGRCHNQQTWRRKGAQRVAWAGPLSSGRLGQSWSSLVWSYGLPWLTNSWGQGRSFCHLWTLPWTPPPPLASQSPW